MATKGRPRGTRNPEPLVVVVQTSRCPRCGSPERSAYWGKHQQDHAGVRDGVPFARIVRRRCRCRACGQVRIDKTYE